MRHFISLFLLFIKTITLTGCSPATISLDDYALLPKPQQVTFGCETFKIDSLIVQTPYWNDRMTDILGIPVAIEGSTGYTLKCIINTDSIYGDSVNDESYRLQISSNGILIEAPGKSGIYWGAITLSQLIKEDEKGRLTVPQCEIIDWPAFPIRGFMMDTGRSFISLEELKREIDLMSRFKLNTFHWHLTENQGWRLESKIYSQLNDSSNMFRQHGQYYTIEEAKDLVQWAKDRNITVIPEIDMPGHSKAFEKTFGFGMQTPQGMAILKQLIDEACETFADVPYFHIGTDEVAFVNPDFVPEMVQYVRNHNKKVISWNPGWNYKPGEIDMIQMWSYRGKSIDGIPTIDSRYHYINHFDTYADIVALYRSNVYGEKKETDNIKGLTLALWNDRYIDNENHLIAQNNLYPLLLATAERTWDGGGEEYFNVLGTNMSLEGSEDFNNFVDFERRLLTHKATTLMDVEIPYVKQTNVKWFITDAFPNNGDLTAVFPPETIGPQKQYTYKDSIYNGREAIGAGIYLRHVWGTSVPAFYENPQPNHTAYAFTNVYSPVDQEVGLMVETQNYSRSEPDLAPPQGAWDYRGSKIWINGEELQPPVWTSVHTEKSNEITLGNENMAVRKPIEIKLHKGWNTVMLKLPVGEFNTPQVRLVKWMFTFVFTTLDGKEAAPNLIYSPFVY